MYAFVGRTVQGRQVAGEGLLAHRAFVVWWYALAALSLLGAATTFMGAFGMADLGLVLTLTYTYFLLVCVALWGLLFYLFYLFTGGARRLIPLTVFYVLFYVLLVFLINAGQTRGRAPGAAGPPPSSTRTPSKVPW